MEDCRFYLKFLSGVKHVNGKFMQPGTVFRINYSNCFLKHVFKSSITFLSWRSKIKIGKLSLDIRSDIWTYVLSNNPSRVLSHFIILLFCVCLILRSVMANLMWTPYSISSLLNWWKNPSLSKWDTSHAVVDNQIINIFLARDRQPGTIVRTDKKSWMKESVMVFLFNTPIRLYSYISSIWLYL